MNTLNTVIPPRTGVGFSPVDSISSVDSSVTQQGSRETLRPGDGLRVEVRGVERDSYIEYFVSGYVERPMSSTEAADELFACVAEVLSSRGILTIQEKVFGLSELRPLVLGVRETQYGRHRVDAGVPTTWIMGAPLCGCDFVGVQIWGIQPLRHSVTVTTVSNPVTGLGREVRGPGFRMLYLPEIRGLDERKANLGDGCAQADEMFHRARRALAHHNIGYEKVVRTWIYFARLLQWYDDLNRVRTRHYREIGFGTPGGPAYPASTGIQGRHSDEECMMDVLAIVETEAGSSIARPVHHSPRQDKSFNYGSAFSRGMVFDVEGRRTVSISGTASINPAGETIHLGNAELQCIETLLCISALLEQYGGSLANISSGTLYCKNREVWAAWTRVCRLLGVPEFPTVCMLADVCRDNLLVELEAFAVL